ncbi:MAG: hypothetical protein AB7E09_01210 [Candidatus Izemoplasmatales bacterium]
MKKIFLIPWILVFLLLSSCTMIYRNYNDTDLQSIAIDQFGFSEYSVFKIVDSDTAKYIIGTAYQNSGLIIGVKDNHYAMLFVPKRLSQEPKMVMEDFSFSLEEIYYEINSLEDEFGQKIYNDPANDYGGLSISIGPYENLQTQHTHLDFDSQIVFILTTDTHTFYLAYVGEKVFIFNEEYQILKEQA